MKWKIGSAISATNISLISTALTPLNAKAASQAALLTASPGLTKKIVDRIGLNMLAWIELFVSSSLLIFYRAYVLERCVSGHALGSLY